MNILDTVKGYFIKEGNETQPATKKDFETVYEAIQPVYKEIPPDPKMHKYIVEGVRSWGFMATSAIADEIATTPIHLYRNTKNNSVEIDNHAILNLLNKPNDFQTKEEFLWILVMYLLAEGEAPILLNKPKNPDQMVLLNPEKIKPIFDSTTEGITQYEYQKTNGQMEMVPAEKILFIKLPNLVTPFRGTGYFKYIAQTLDIDNYTEEYLRVFFFNSALPTGVLETDKELNESLVKRIRSQFEGKHRGVKKAHSLAILEKGLKFNQTSFNLNDLQIESMNNSTRDKILAAFKVPKSVLGIIDDVNRANGENADNVFARRAVKPKMRMIEGQINQFLLPKFSDGTSGNLQVEFENPVKDDEKLQAEIDQMYILSGVYTVDEVRERLGLGEKETDQEPEQEEEPKEEQPDEQPEEEKGKFGKILKEFLEGDKKKNFTQEEIERYHEEKIMFSDDIEKEYQEKLIPYFERQKKALVSQLRGKSSRKKQEDINIDFNVEEEKEVYARISAPFIEDAIIRQSGLTYALLGINDTFTSSDDFVREFIKERNFKTGDSINEETKRLIDEILKTWAEEEGTVADLRKSLREIFDENYRAERIARTEISRANGFATDQVYRDSGVIGKQWSTAGDERVCQFCAPMDGVIVPLDKNFWRKGENMVGTNGGKLSFGFEGVKQYPLHVNCRCDILPVFEEAQIPQDPFGYKEESEERAEQLRDEEKKVSEMKVKEEQIRKQELALIEKEQAIQKQIDELTQSQKKVTDKDKKVTSKLKEIEQIKKELDGLR